MPESGGALQCIKAMMSLSIPWAKRGCEWRTVTMNNTLARGRSRTAFVDDVEGIELEGVMLIEPGADKVEEPQAGAS